MGTRSIIGTPNDQGFEGRYVHWDGYPSGVGAAVFETYRQLADLDAVKAYAIREGQEGYWSSYYDPSTPSGDTGWHSDNGNSWANQTDDWGAEYAYLLTERGLDILENRVPGWQRIALVPWDAQDVDWSRLDQGVAA